MTYYSTNITYRFHTCKTHNFKKKPFPTQTVGLTDSSVTGYCARHAFYLLPDEHSLPIPQS